MDPFAGEQHSQDISEIVFAEPVFAQYDAGGQVTRSGDHIRKSGARVRVEESRALHFASSLNLPVPKIVSTESHEGQADIVMEYVDGQCLEDTWPSMDHLQKQTIATDLRHIIMAMRKADPLHHPIGAIGAPARDLRQYSDYEGGPFDKEEDFNHFVLDFLRGTPRLIMDLLAAKMPQNSRLVFTHGDLSPRNIIVKDGHVKALLDWEYAGWYPEYWDFVKFFDRSTSCKDWKDYAEAIFETPYSEHLITFQVLARWQRP